MEIQREHVQWEHVRFAGLLVLAAASQPGCAVSESEDADEATEAEDEDVEEASDAMQERDGSPGAPTADDECMRRCHGVFLECSNSCVARTAERQPECQGICGSHYNECIRSCGYKGGGCQHTWGIPWWSRAK